MPSMWIGLIVWLGIGLSVFTGSTRSMWIVWLVFGLYVFTGSTRFDERYREFNRIAMIALWLFLGFCFETGK